MNAARHTALTEPVDPEIAAREEDFKAAFRVHPAGVALVSAASATGPVGLTASSLASVAADPPVLSFSVTRSTGSAGALLGADTFVVQLLADHQADVARAFARSGAPRFTTEQGWTRLPTGEPVLADARAVFRCRALQLVPVGSSTLVVAEVLEVIPGPPAPPLVYHDRRFLSLDPEASEI